MDFLDPRRKKAHRRRLFIGYGLMAIVVAIGTLLALYVASGWDVNRKSGEFIQNGIVFVDSKPKGATIYINDVAERNKTDARLVMPAGTYTIRLEAEGYRTWQRTFKLDGGQIERLVYPFLVPNSLTISDIKTYDSTPQLATQSPDRRWVLVQRPGQTYLFDVFDLADPATTPIQVALPITSLTKPSADARLEILEWSTDNKHILIKRTYEDKNEFIIFNREATADTVNLNTVLGIAPVEVSLRNKRPDQVYFLDAFPGVLRSANVKARTISAPLISMVIDYKTYGDDIVLYVTQEGSQAGKADFKVLEADKTYVLKTVPQSDVYVMDVSKYDGDWYFVVGGASENIAYVFKDPLPSLKQAVRAPIDMTMMRLENPRFISFSANTQFISLQSGKKILTLDLEYDSQYKFELDQDVPVTQEVKWMDGHRYVYVYNQESYIVDFDGSNKQTLVTSKLSNGPFFDRDYENVFTVEDSKVDSTKNAFTLTVIAQR